MIARMWRGWVRTGQATAYVDYITDAGLRGYAATEGNLGAQMWTRDLGDGRTEVVTVSWWESRTAIEGFAGSDIDVAVFYPEDDRYLVDRETTVWHYEVPADVTVVVDGVDGHDIDCKVDGFGSMQLKSSVVKRV